MSVHARDVRLVAASPSCRVLDHRAAASPCGNSATRHQRGERHAAPRRRCGARSPVDESAAESSPRRRSRDVVAVRALGRQRAVAGADLSTRAGARQQARTKAWTSGATRSRRAVADRMKRKLLTAAATLAVAAAFPQPPRPRHARSRGAYHETDAGSCTLNFAYSGGGKTYLGTAAHCVASIGQRVRDIDGTEFGKVAFIGDQNTTAWDFAFIEVDAEDLGRVSPAVKGHPAFPKGVDDPGRDADRRLDPALRLRPRLRHDAGDAGAAQGRHGLRRHVEPTPSAARSTGATRADRSSTSAPARRSASSAACAPAPAARRARRSRASSPRPPRAASVTLRTV